MRFSLILACCAVAASTIAVAQSTNPQIDFGSYVKLTQEVRPYRQKRLLRLEAFRKQAENPKVLLLDARSETAFNAGHIEGAVNLPFPDFTAESLARVIGPDRDRPILIYCNNNFRDNKFPVVTKATPLALNIQTFVNLYGYGYKNVWELADVVTMDNPVLGWVKG